MKKLSTFFVKEIHRVKIHHMAKISQLHHRTNEWILSWESLRHVLDMSQTCRKVVQMSEIFDSNIEVFNME